MQLYYLFLYFFVYSFIGWCSEVAFAAFKERRFVNRGFLNGPYCPIYGFGVVIVVSLLSAFEKNLILLFAASVILTTLLEGFTGWVLDKIFHNKWWDYSDMPVNIGGYVCLVFSLMWGVACVVILKVLHPLIHKLLAFISGPLGIILIVALSVTMFADLYVTASAILRFNRQLAAMNRIAEELHELSDQLGSEIYEKTIHAIEKQEAFKEKQEVLKEKRQDFIENMRDLSEDFSQDIKEFSEDVHDFSEGISEEIRNRIAELKKRSLELNRSADKSARRLVSAFPKMQPHQYKEQFETIKERLHGKFK